MRTELRVLPSLLLLTLAGVSLAAGLATDARAAGPAREAFEQLTVPIPERAFAVDVVQNGQNFFFEGEVTQDGVPEKGSPFVTTGFIYPADTLAAYGVERGITAEGEPEFPHLVLGTWTCRGWHLQRGDAATGVVVVTTQTFDFSRAVPGSHMVVTDGIELADFDVPFSRPVTGGTGRFDGADGEMRQTYLSFNASGGFNMTFATRTNDTL